MKPFSYSLQLTLAFISLAFTAQVITAESGSGSGSGSGNDFDDLDSAAKANISSEEEVEIMSSEDLTNKIEIKSRPPALVWMAAGGDLHLRMAVRVRTEKLIRNEFTFTSHREDESQEMYRCKDKRASAPPNARKLMSKHEEDRRRHFKCQCRACDAQKNKGHFLAKRMRQVDEVYTVSRDQYTSVDMVVYDMISADNETRFTFQVGTVMLYETTVMIERNINALNLKGGGVNKHEHGHGHAHKKEFLKNDIGKKPPRKSSQHAAVVGVVLACLVGCVLVAMVTRRSVVRMSRPRGPATWGEKRTGSSKHRMRSQKDFDISVNV